MPDSAVFPNDTHSYQHDKICGLEIQTGMLIQFVGTREQREMGTLFLYVPIENAARCLKFRKQHIIQENEKKLTDHIIHTECIQLER